MPYPNAKQAVAVFMSIRRRQGEQAAKEFGRRHRGDLARAARERGGRAYKSRKSRSR